jgi:hypothetical protein
MQQTTALLRLLTDAGFEFIVIGGVAAAAHGSSAMTLDLDVAAPFTVENMDRLLSALSTHHPCHRIMPGKPAIRESADQLATLKNLYIQCDIGAVDIVGELPPVGGYNDAATNAVEAQVLGTKCRVIAIDDLIRIKELLGRPKDLEAAGHLRAIRDRRGSV